MSLLRFSAIAMLAASLPQLPEGCPMPDAPVAMGGSAPEPPPDDDPSPEEGFGIPLNRHDRRKEAKLQRLRAAYGG